MAQEMVTVAIATYNSASFIVETLDSVAAQTYPALELIISDDCSTDNTVDICRNWMNQNESRFLCSSIITVPFNTGVAANANRLFQRAGSKWIKSLGGDDILLPQCIELNMRFVQANPRAVVVFSQVLLYRNTFSEHSFLRSIPDPFPTNLMHDHLTVNDQYKLLLLSDRITYTPSVFLNRQTVLNLGGFDESIPLIEDYPMWLKLTSAGHRLYYFHKPTVGYRQHERALNNIEQAALFKPLYLKTWRLKKKYIFPHIPWDIAWGERFSFGVSVAFQLFGLNRPGLFYNRLYNFLSIYINPFRYIVFFKKKFLGYKNSNLFYQ